VEASNPPFAGAPALVRIWTWCSPARALQAIRRNQRLGWEMFGVAWGQIVAAAGGICAVRILTGLLTPEAYGELALALTVSTLAQLAVLAPVAASGQRFFAVSRESGETQSFLEAIGLLFAGATVVVLTFGGVSVLLVWSLAPKWLPLMGAGVLLAWLTGTNSILNAIQNASRERNVVSWHQALEQWLRALLPLGLAAVYVAGSTTTIYAYCLGAILVFVSQLALFWKVIGSRLRWQAPDRAAVRRKLAQFWAYSWPFATWGLFTWAQSASDRWALEVFRQRADVGVYQVLYQVGYSPIILITGYIGWVAGPILFARVSQGGPADLNKVWRVLKRIIVVSLAGTLLASALAACFSHFILSLLAAPPYRSGAPLLPLFTLNGGLFATGQFATLQLMCGSRTGMLVVPKIATAVLGVGANLLGSYCWGPIGVCFAGTVTSAVYFLWMLRLARTQMYGGRGPFQTSATEPTGSVAQSGPARLRR
jgi:O-antigen/teichoic acid export membrane protein